MKKMSFSTLATTPEVVEKSTCIEHVNKSTKNEFQQLKDRQCESKAEIVMVGIRMTKAERRQLRAMAGQLEIPIQDIVRHGIALYREKQGLR
jgi:hypothetical protein